MAESKYLYTLRRRGASGMLHDDAHLECESLAKAVAALVTDAIQPNGGEIMMVKVEKLPREKN